MLMATVFWDRKGVMMVEFMQKRTTGTPEGYCETQKELLRTIQNKTLGMLTSGVVLLHDSARPHAAARTRALLSYFNWELFDHLPYSPDLAPSDKRLFTRLKNSASTIMRN
jgi:histone-lysine N-methyltransferase SETMAR